MEVTMYGLLIARLQEAYEAELKALYKTFWQERTDFYQAFKKEILMAHTAFINGKRVKVSSTLQDALSKLEQSQAKREENVHLKYQAEALLLAEKARQEWGVPCVVN
jgi:hypothetical protein